MTENQNPFATINANNLPRNILSYEGKLRTVCFVFLKNLILTVITLGIYRSWAKTRMRKYIFGSFKIADKNLEYTGTGGELFRGLIVTIIAFFLFASAVDYGLEKAFPEQYILAETSSFKPEPSFQLRDLTTNNQFDVETCLKLHSAEKCNELYIEYERLETFQLDFAQQIEALKAMLLMLSPYVIGFILAFYYAKFSGYRYRLSRTKWLESRGRVVGCSSFGYVLLCLKRLLLNIISLGILKGRSDISKCKYMLNNSYFGSYKFNFEPNIKQLDKINFVTLLLSIPTFGISRAWYKAALLNLKYNSLSIAEAKFSSNFNASKLLWLKSSNFMLLFLTFGLATPIAIQRSVKFFSNNVKIITNPLAIESLVTSNSEKTRAGTMGESVQDSQGFSSFEVDFGLI